MKIIIEVPGINDHKRVNELAKQVQELHVEWNPDIYVSVDEVIQSDYYESLIRNNEIITAKIENEIVGYLVFTIKEVSVPILRRKKVMAIDSICVDEKFRGLGIGTRMLEYVKDLAGKSGCTDLSLSVYHSNTNAVKMYESFGFKKKNISYTMKI